MTAAADHLIPGPVLSLGPGLGVHPSRQDFTPTSQLAKVPGYISVAEALVHRARSAPDAEAFFLLDVEDRLSTLTNAGLLARAQLAAAALARRGVGRGDRVFLSFDTCPEMLSAFFGCNLLGAVPLLAEPPLGFARHRSWQDRVRKMLTDSDARALIVEDALRALVQPVAAERSGLPVLGPAELLEPGTAPDAPALRSDELAFIQFSSGTTSDAKGVMVTNQALMANVRGMATRTQYRENELTVGWLPLHHDMGLLMTVLWPFLYGRVAALMPPRSFIFKPQRWLWAMHYFRGNFSPSPNFGYQLCVNKIPDDELQGLDLSSWRVALNGAEFIHARTVRQFHERFGSRGFRSTTHYPAYGMAEVVVGGAFPHPGKEPRVDLVSRERLSEHGEAVPVAPEDPSAMPLVCVGPAFDGHAVKIVDADGQELPERRQGQILLRGPSVTAGYIQQPEATAATYRDGWVWTGDLGYKVGDELFISGRIKDLIIKGGRNYHPYALEAAAGQVPGSRPGGVAAFGANDPESGTEQVMMVVETQLEDAGQITALCRQVGQAVFETTGLRPDRVLTAPPRTLPKTSSGKLQRGVIRDMVLSGKLPSVKS